MAQRPAGYDNSIHGKRLPISTKVAVMALKDSGVSANEAGRMSGVHQTTIVRCWENPELQYLTPANVQKTKTGLGGLFYSRALESTLAISADKIAQSSALQLATVAGIMTEKGRLMEGLSTENLSFRGVSQSIEADRQALMKRIDDLKNAT